MTWRPYRPPVREAHCRPNRLLVPVTGVCYHSVYSQLGRDDPRTSRSIFRKADLFVFGDVFFGHERAEAMQPRILRQIPEFADLYAVKLRKPGQFRDHGLDAALFFFVRKKIRVRSTVPSLTALNMTLSPPMS